MSKHRSYASIFASLIAFGLLLIQGVESRPIAPPPRSADSNLAHPKVSLQPPLVTVDQVIHNKGNIVTTLDNWGYIGGYQFYELPSGEWPRNSGHDYIGEIRYWMGATKQNGDTVVANSVDDFMGVPVSGPDDYRIFLSTDTSRYFGYDVTDTTGISAGNPAQGWRVWDPNSSTYDYNQTFNTLAASFVQAGPTSLQDSHYRFTDQAGGQSVLGLELTHTAYQWNYCYNEDFMFFVIQITNTSTEDYTDFAFGLYVDLDVGGPDGTGENGRLEDLVAFDSTENLAWIYDNIGIDPGWGPTVRTGIMGTKYLETPDNIGMTAFRSGDWAIISELRDEDMYAQINSQQYDQSLPPTDQFYIQCTRGIQLDAGKTVRVVYALVAGEDEEDFRANAGLAQELYDAHFVGPQPPTTPVLTVRPGNEKTYLTWTDTSEIGTDPLSGMNDFAGYKLYRSDNQGKTWGVVEYNTGNNCLTVDYRTIAQFTVNTPGDPIAHSYLDTGLFNGVDYWYCLAAFDIGDTAVGVDPLQSGFGVAGESPNVIAARPRANPAGFYEAAATVDHYALGAGELSDGLVTPFVFDATELRGADYEVRFQDTQEKTVWHLINVTTGDTVLADQTQYNDDPDLYPVGEGLRLYVEDAEHVPRDLGQTGFATGDSTMVVATFYGPAIPALTGDNGDVFTNSAFRSYYELRYTEDSTLASWMLDGFFGSDNSYRVPFEAWNMTTNQQVSLAVYDFDDDGIWQEYDLIAIVDYPYDPNQSIVQFAFPYQYGWLVGFDDAVFDPAVGDVFTIEGAPLVGPNDVFVFKVDGVNTAAAAIDLDDIRVVPDPYIASYSSMVETGEGQSVLEFQGVPQVCTIRIYSLAGDLIEEIKHDEVGGTARWNLQSSNFQQVTSGIYIYHVESEFGDHLGRFAVIK